MLDIAKQLKVSYKTICRDKKEIQKELIRELKTEPIEKYLFELDANLSSLSEEFWKIYYETTGKGENRRRLHPNTRIGALNSIKDLSLQKINVLQRLGIIREEPIKIKEDIKENRIEEALIELRKEIDNGGVKSTNKRGDKGGNKSP